MDFLKSIKTLEHYFDLYDINPLGACESYGTSWSLDREYTTKLLGFFKDVGNTTGRNFLKRLCPTGLSHWND